MPSQDGVLAGVRVIDLTRALAGPYCTMLLADLGAEVIKVEPPDGDSTRRTGPYTDDDTEQAYGGYFHSVNRNKRSVSVDLKRPEGRQIVRAAVKDADILVENYRAGVMDRLDLSYESLREINPRLVYACLRGFGDPRTGESPYQYWPALDVVAQAMGGLMGITGQYDQPTKVGPGVGDIFPATLCALGAVAAMHQAARSGQGQLVDVSMYDGVLSMCERIVYQHSYTGEVPGPQGNGHPLLSPFGIFPAADGWVAIAAPAESQWSHLCSAMNAPSLTSDERFDSEANRTVHNQDVQEAVAAWTSRHRKADIVRKLAGRVPCGPVNTVADIFDDPHVRARSMVVTVEQPGPARDVALAGTPIKFTEAPTARPRRAPLLGEDTADFLRGLGYPPGEVARLKRERIAS